MATSKSKEGPTPNGGVRSTITFFDDNGQPVEQEEATTAIGIEYGKDGNQIQRTYFRMKEKKGANSAQQ